MLSCEVWETFKNIYFDEQLRTAASENVFMKLRKTKIYSQAFWKKTGFLNINIRNKFMILYFMIGFP